MGKALFVVAVFMMGTASAAGIDPRLDQAINTNLIASAERSVQFEKTLPQPVLPAKPAVDHGEMAKVGEGVYVERRLIPQAGATQDDKAIRIYRRDTR